MSDIDLESLIKKVRENYKEIGHIECPAFGGEKIYFTNKGFNHLVRKGRKYRENYEQIRRLNLFFYVVSILKTSAKFDKYKITKKQIESSEGIRTSIAHFWSFRKKIGSKNIFVVICQINNGPKSFISVVDR